MTALRIRMSDEDVQKMRLAISPLTELALSFYAIQSGEISPLHGPWVARVRAVAPRLDLEVLRALLPVRGHIPDFFFAGVRDANTTLEGQLESLRSCPEDQVTAGLMDAWHTEDLPAPVRHLSRPAQRELIIGALREYWRLCMAPDWEFIRSALEDDVAYRSKTFVNKGLGDLVRDVNDRLSLEDDHIVVSRWRCGGEFVLRGGGLALIPSVFAGQHLLWRANADGASFLGYPCRGAGSLWRRKEVSRSHSDSLGALLGRGRAAVLLAAATPRSTTELAQALGQSPGTVSAHLSILRASGLVSAWRVGRRVLYGITSLGASIAAANAADLRHSGDR
jgi:DNA-binding transcriptional ArsR family regulator